MIHTSDKTEGQLYIPVINWIRKPAFSQKDHGNLFISGHQL